MEVEIHTSRTHLGRIKDADKCNFHHPFSKPYKVQLELMESIYNTIDGDYKVGIFESPTGTGKTLSLICSTMTWLREYKKLKNEAEIKKMESEANDDDEDEPEWVKKAYKEKIVDRMMDDAKRYEQHLINLEHQGPKMVTGTVNKRRHVKKKKSVQQDVDEDDLAPEDYFEGSSKGAKLNDVDAEVKRLLEKLDSTRSTAHVEKSTAINESPIRIYFSSRTHSQLTQFCSQLRMTQFPSSFDGIDEKTKYLPMGSRKQLCINEKVNCLKDSQQINEKCLDLQKKGDDSCPFVPNLNRQQDFELVEEFRDTSFSKVYDIEDLNSIGSNLKICPYYSTRQGLTIAEIVSLPYQLLLQRDTRTALNLNLKDCIVVIDEAHNLIDTISAIYSSAVSFGELKSIRKGLQVYMRRFNGKMNPGNRINLTKLHTLVTLLAKFIKQQINQGKVAPGTEVDANDIFAGTTGDLLNVYPLMEYINKSKIAFKLQTYMDKEEQRKHPEEKHHSSTPLLFKVRSFMYCLANTSTSGKFFFDHDGPDADGTVLKYLLLDPSEPFREVVEEARCVLMAGGTMEPVTDFTDFLVPYIDQKQINTFSCDHIVEEDHLEVYPIARSGNEAFEFTFNKRNDMKMLTELGRSLLRIIEQVPAGVVLFFPSYKYLAQVVAVWKSTGLLRLIEQRKRLFTESRDVNVDDVLRDYSAQIRVEGKGAVLFSVVGGKMSEGINFSDDLARAVVMIGLPYPNVKSGDLIARSNYIEQKTLQAGGTSTEAKKRSQEMYQNICMKAVNQSVGRAIRNIDDYAVIYLIDSRYRTPRVQTKLSRWIQKRLMPTDDIGGALKRTSEFFATKQ